MLKISLRFKLISMVVGATILLCVVSVVLGHMVYSTTMDHHYRVLTSNLAKTAASQMDGDKIVHYYESVRKIDANDSEAVNRIKDEDYYRMLDILFDIKEANDILYIYVQKLEGNHTTYIFDTDESEDFCELGTYNEVSEATTKLENPELGIPAFISNDTFGWLSSSMEPIFNEAGEPVALVGVDISMDEIMADRQDYLIHTIAVLAAGTLILTFILLIATSKSVLVPIKKLQVAAQEISAGNLNHRVDIHTEDELEDLGNSFNKMTKDLLDYMANLKEVTAEKERIGAELGVATQIQASMLPCIFPAFPERSEFDIYASMTPAKEVGGDFYDFFLVDDDHLAMVIADVSGKGVPAALFMVIAKTLLKNCAQTGASPAQVLEKVNKQLCENNQAEMFVTVWLGVLTISTGQLTCANAGHEYPAIMRKDGEYELIKDKHGFVLAGMDDSTYQEYELKLNPGDRLYVYTDGVAEATDAGNTLFGTGRMLWSLNGHKEATLEELLLLIKNDIDAFVGTAPQFDDITMLSLKYKGTEVEHDEGIGGGSQFRELNYRPDFYRTGIGREQLPDESNHADFHCC